MSGKTFDALDATGMLREAGFEDRQAEAVADVMRRSVNVDRGVFATKADLDSLGARLNARLAALETRLTARMVAVGGLIVATVKSL